MKLWLGILLVAAIAGAWQISRPTVRMVPAAPPGSSLVVGADGVSLVAGGFVQGTPAAPGCILQANGTYKLPVTPRAIAVYRNGLRQSTVQDYSLAGDVLTLTPAPVAGDTVLCDYSY